MVLVRQDNVAKVTQARLSEEQDNVAKATQARLSEEQDNVAKVTQVRLSEERYDCTRGAACQESVLGCAF